MEEFFHKSTWSFSLIDMFIVIYYSCCESSIIIFIVVIVTFLNNINNGCELLFDGTIV